MRRNPYREIIGKYAKRKKICTQCFARPSAPKRAQCQRCIDTNYRKRTKPAKGLRRILNKLYKRGVKYGKSTNRD